MTVQQDGGGNGVAVAMVAMEVAAVRRRCKAMLGGPCWALPLYSSPRACKGEVLWWAGTPLCVHMRNAASARLAGCVGVWVRVWVRAFVLGGWESIYGSNEDSSHLGGGREASPDETARSILLQSEHVVDG